MKGSVKDTVSLGQCLYFTFRILFRECCVFSKQKLLVFGMITAFESFLFYFCS
jgi:hypothetical protein